MIKLRLACARTNPAQEFAKAVTDTLNKISSRDDVGYKTTTEARDCYKITWYYTDSEQLDRKWDNIRDRTAIAFDELEYDETGNIILPSETRKQRRKNPSPASIMDRWTSTPNFKVMGAMYGLKIIDNLKITERRGEVYGNHVTPVRKSNRTADMENQKVFFMTLRVQQEGAANKVSDSAWDMKRLDMLLRGLSIFNGNKKVSIDDKSIIEDWRRLCPGYKVGHFKKKGNTIQIIPFPGESSAEAAPWIDNLIKQYLPDIYPSCTVDDTGDSVSVSYQPQN